MAKLFNFMVDSARVGMAMKIIAVTVVLFLITKWDFLIALTLAYLTMAFGLKMLGGFSQPMAEPPPPGEMRKVKLNYRCDICGSEARMTLALDEDPPAPRHCLDDMILITPVE